MFLVHKSTNQKIAPGGLQRSTIYYLTGRTQVSSTKDLTFLTYCLTKIYTNIDYILYKKQLTRVKGETETKCAMREDKRGTWKYEKDGEGICLYRKVRVIESSELEVRKG